MNANNDEVIARLRVTLRSVADRTPVGAGRLPAFADATTATTSHSRSRTTMTALSAAAAVAAIAAVTASVAGSHHGVQHSLSPGAPNPVPLVSSNGPASSAVASKAPGNSAAVASAPVASASAALTAPPSTPTPVASAVAGSAVPQSAPACVPANDYVIASPAQLTGLTYLLPAAPAGYTFYGAWGTISGNDCPGSQNWYVEYDRSPVNATTNISITVSRDVAEAQPEAAIATTVQGHDAWVLNKDATYGEVVWQVGDVDFQVSGPMVGGTPDALVAFANTLTAVSPTDPRIVAPLNCQIAPGNTCPENLPTPTPSPTATSAG